MPPRLSTGSVVSLTWAGTNGTRHHERHHGERQGDQEDRAPPEVLQQEPASSGPSDEIAPPSADHKAIVLVRAGPDHRAVINASVVG